jgi:DNA-binding transcriptional LysR family regulator
VFLDKLNEAMQMLAGAVEASRQVERGIVGKLRIGYTGLASDLVLPRLIREFRDQHPAIGLDIVGPSPSGAMELALLNKEIDVALCFLPLHHVDLESRTLITSELAVVLPNRHPLAELTSVPVKQLADEAFVAYPANEGFHLREAVDIECFRAGFRARIVKESAASQTLLCHVAAGNGVAIMPLENQARGIEGETFRPLSPKEAPLLHGMAWRRSDQSATLSQFLAVAAEVFP